MLTELEAGRAVAAPETQRVKQTEADLSAPLQASLEDDQKQAFLQTLSQLQVETMTPLEALNVLFKASQDARAFLH